MYYYINVKNSKFQFFFEEKLKKKTKVLVLNKTMSCISNNSDISARLHELEDRIIKLETIISDLIDTDKIKNIPKKPQKRGPKMPELVNVDKLTRDKDKLIIESKYGKKELNLTLKEVLNVIKVFKAGNDKFEFLVKN